MFVDRRILSRYNIRGYTFGVVSVMLLLFTVMAPGLRAELANSTEMSNVCQNWLTQTVSKTGSWAGETEPVILESGGFFAGDTLLGVYYNISPEGYVLVPILKEMQPVKAYSDRGRFDPDAEDGMVQMLREVLSSRLRVFETQFGSLDAVQPAAEAIFDPVQKAQWDRLAVTTREFSVGLAQSSLEENGPLTTTSWNQGYPYNILCPMGDGGRTVVGCVATAAAQIMAYWQWPPSGVGSHTYTWEGDNSCGGSTPPQVLSADFSDPYDWANIVDSCDTGCDAAQRDALSELCYEVGVAYEMDYGNCGSGANTSYGTTVYPTYFKFSPECSRQNRIDYDVEGWFQLGQAEIEAGRVANYRINLHAIVLDGWRDQGMGWYEFHMNYGWGQENNTWYVLDHLYCGWVDGDVCPWDEEFMIVDIYPQTEPIMSFVNKSVDDSGGDEDGHADPGETVMISATIVNNGWDAENTTGTLTTTDPYVDVVTPTTAFDAMIPWGDESTGQTAYEVEIDPSCPDPHIVTFVLSLSADGGYASADTFYVFVGDTPSFADDVESGEGFWTQQSMTFGYVTNWHLCSFRQNSGSVSWKVGGYSGGPYSDNSDAGLVTPPFLLPPNAELSFWHWLAAEEDWDGGVVYISTDNGPWEVITPEGGYPNAIIENPASPFNPGEPCYSGSFDWSQAVFDLSDYSGVARIMFRFGSDGFVTEEGWYVDDVEVYIGSCCGVYTGGFTGNTNCSDDGDITLSDISRLIDHLYISKEDLCCLENGNANGDGAGDITLADISRLIDHLYISKEPTASCP